MEITAPDNEFELNTAYDFILPEVAQNQIGRGMNSVLHIIDDPMFIKQTTNPATIMKADKVVFDISDVMQTFNSKMIRMSNQDVDVIELIAFIVDYVNRRVISGEAVATSFVSLRTGDDAIILHDCVVMLYYGLFKRLDPWLAAPNVKLIFNNYDYQNMELHITIC